MPEETAEQTLRDLRAELARVNERLDQLTRAEEESRRRWEVFQDLGKDVALVGYSAFESAIEEMQDLDPSVSIEDTFRLVRRLFESARTLEWALGQIDSLRDLAKDVGPVLTEAMGSWTTALDAADRDGTFLRVGALARALDHVAGAYTPEQLQNLAHRLAELAKQTQEPSHASVTGLLRHALTSYQEAASTPAALDLSFFGILRRARRPEIRRGIALTLEVLGGIGRGISKELPPDAGTSPERLRGPNDNGNDSGNDRPVAKQ